jgi:hypothetical protein
VDNHDLGGERRRLKAALDLGERLPGIAAAVGIDLDFSPAAADLMGALPP